MRFSILVLEPDPIRWQQLRTVLISRGYDPVSVSTAREAVVVLESCEVDRILVTRSTELEDHLALVRSLAANPDVGVLLPGHTDKLVATYRTALGRERVDVEEDDISPPTGARSSVIIAETSGSPRP